MSMAVLLRAARALIADPDHWTTGCAARDVHGRSVMPESPKAIRFSGFGALSRLAPVDHDLRDRTATALNAAVTPSWWIRWEDALGRTHAEVLVALDRAIAAADIVEGLAINEM